ncbi:MAG: magnesium chelatase subunit D [Pseudomonadota bacterium]
MERAEAEARWSDACLAASIFALDPGRVGGLWVIARAGPVRQRFLDEVGSLLGRLPRVAPSIPTERLTGGIDLAATLANGRAVYDQGLIAQGGSLLAPMAERISPGIAAVLGQAIDSGEVSLIALDERAEDEEAIPNLLAERLGLVVPLEGLMPQDCITPGFSRSDVSEAHQRLKDITLSDDRTEQIAVAGMMLGTGLRASLHAVAAARATAALWNLAEVDEDCIAAALRLVLAPRATRLPAMDSDETEAETAPETEQDPTQNAESKTESVLQEMTVETARAQLPPGLLTAMVAGSQIRAEGRGGAGAERKMARRGRPAGLRPGRPGAGARLDVAGTLRTAAPWQRIRQKPPSGGLAIRVDDFRIQRLKERAETLTIFAVDASGSAAIARLAEAKGAVEVMLAEAYRRRDHITVIAFRGDTAEILLPPTRALARAKRALSGLPGGGGTPLAAGLLEALALAENARRRGQTPMLVALTDGKGNVPLSPGDAQQAKVDVERAAKAVRARDIPALVVDTAKRPQKRAEDLAHEMGARYVTMPRMDPRALSETVRAGG